MSRAGEVWEHIVRGPTPGLASDLWLVTRSARIHSSWRHELLDLETGELDAAYEFDGDPWPDRPGARRVA